MNDEDNEIVNDDECEAKY